MPGSIFGSFFFFSKFQHIRISKLSWRALVLRIREFTDREKEESDFRK